MSDVINNNQGYSVLLMKPDAGDMILLFRMIGSVAQSRLNVLRIHKILFLARYFSPGMTCFVAQSGMNVLQIDNVFF